MLKKEILKKIGDSPQLEKRLKGLFKKTWLKKLGDSHQLKKELKPLFLLSIDTKKSSI